MSIYVAKVIKNEVTSKYVLWQYEIVQDTFESTGWIKFIFCNSIVLIVINFFIV